MYNNHMVLLILATFFIAGCSTTSNLEPQKIQKKFFNSQELDQLYYEDSYILYALQAEHSKDYRSASELFYKLYNKTQNKEYLYHSLQNDIDAQAYQMILDKLKDISYEDIKIKRAKLIAYLELKDFNRAKKYAVEVVEETHEVEDYLRLADLELKMGALQQSLQTLQKAYEIHYDTIVIEKIAFVLYQLDRKDEAIRRLETHRKINGNSEGVLIRLAVLYSEKKDMKHLLEIYLTLYEINHDNDIAKRIITIYEYQKDFYNLKLFLEHYDIDKRRLLELYVVTRNFQAASALAYKLYKEEGNDTYLVESALYEYEYYKVKKEKEILKSVVKKFEQYLKNNDVALYNNYLGYLLIDHDIDIQKGITYVKKALKQEPNSAFILDSLAWGYYKKRECKKANSIMQKVFQLLDKEQKEILQHQKDIQKCIKTEEKR